MPFAGLEDQAEALLCFLDEPSARLTPVERAAVGVILEVRDLETAYGLSRVIRGIPLEVQAGEVVYLLGKNGAGKTTTLWEKHRRGRRRPARPGERARDRLLHLRAGGEIAV